MRLSFCRRWRSGRYRTAGSYQIIIRPNGPHTKLVGQSRTCPRHEFTSPPPGPDKTDRTLCLADDRTRDADQRSDPSMRRDRTESTVFMRVRSVRSGNELCGFPSVDHRAAVQVIQTRSSSTAESKVAAALVLLIATGRNAVITCCRLLTYQPLGHYRWRSRIG